MSLSSSSVAQTDSWSGSGSGSGSGTEQKKKKKKGWTGPKGRVTKFTNEGGSSETSGRRDARTRILTMKYGKQQMSLIRKRVKVEEWLMDRLEILFRNAAQGENSFEDMELDEFLDLDNDAEREQIILTKLKDCPADAAELQAFVKDFLLNLKTL